MAEGNINQSGQNPSSATPAGLEREADNLQNRFTSLRGLQSASRMQLIAVVVVVVLMFVIFTFATLGRIRSNFNASAVEQAFSTRAGDMLPIVQQMLVDAGRGSWPTYSALGQERLKEFGPQFSSQFMARFQALPDELGKQTQPKFEKAFITVEQRLEEDLNKAFPDLPQEKRRAMLEQFQKEVATAVEKQLEAIVANEMIKLDAALEKFNIPEAEIAQDTEKLHRDFLRSMIHLADYHVRVMDEQSQADEMSAAISPAIKPATRPAGQ